MTATMEEIIAATITATGNSQSINEKKKDDIVYYNVIM